MKRIVIWLLLVAGCWLLWTDVQAQQIPNGAVMNWSWSGTGTPTFSVYRATVSGGETQPPLASGLAGTSPCVTPNGTIQAPCYIDTTAVVGTEYFYTFTATVGGVQSMPSAEVHAQITVPPAPTNPGTAVF